MLVAGLRREYVEQVGEGLGVAGVGGGRGRLTRTADVAEELGELVQRPPEDRVDAEGGGEGARRGQRPAVGQLLSRVVEDEAEAHLLAGGQSAVRHVLPETSRIQ